MTSNEIIKKIFPVTDNYSLLQYDEEGLWSITHPVDADKISNIIKRELGSNISIMDCTAGIGGNTISFSKFFNKVVSVEMNSNKFSLLKNNIECYLLTNITLINDDCNNVNVNCNCYFYDPPWGGPNYKNENSIRLKLGNKSLFEIVNNKKNVFMKLPNNYDLEEFNNFNYKIYKIKNYLLLSFN